MTVTHLTTTGDVRAHRALGSEDTLDLVERLKTTLRDGQPFDETVVWELANRALEAEYPETAARIENGYVVRSI